jgi:cytochrome b561
MMNSSTRYTTPAIAFHWLLAVAIVASFILGVYMTDLPFSPQRIRLYNFHKWGGICILALSALRLLWRLTHRPPASLAMPVWQHRAAHFTHLALYLLFFATPLVGWAYSSAAGFPIALFGVWVLPDWVPADKALAEAIKPWHALMAYSMAALVVVHVGAAIKHQWIDRDGLLQRMWPGRG